MLNEIYIILNIIFNIIMSTVDGAVTIIIMMMMMKPTL